MNVKGGGDESRMTPGFANIGEDLVWRQHDEFRPGHDEWRVHESGRQLDA